VTGFRPEDIFRAFSDHGVDYVTVGAFALAAHGLVRATRDVDVIPSPDAGNLERLAQAITALGGVPHGEPDTPVTAELLARQANMRFETAAGQLDVLLDEQYRRRFPELASRAVAYEVGDVEVTVVSRNDLILLKAGTGRARDLVDIGDLLALEVEG
jgi:hypothetical protein